MERVTGVIKPVDANLWCMDSHFVVCGCKGSLRMTIIRKDGALVLYSPVAFNATGLSDLKDLGDVAVVIAPNLFHHMYLRPCLEAFPQARALIPEGLEAKIGPIAGAEIMSDAGGLDLTGDIDVHVFTGHQLHETLLFHRPTATLITADMLYNYQAEHFTFEKAFFAAIGCYGGPKLAFYHRFAVRDQGAVRRLIAKIQDWKPQRIIMSHGRIVDSDDAAAIFTAAWEGLAGL